MNRRSRGTTMDDSVGTTTFTTTKQEDDVDATTITVYRSSGGKDQFSFSLATATLNDLKGAVAVSDTLGRIPSHQQRVFYMGRELKTGARSLFKLLGGNHQISVVHVHSTSSSARQNGNAQKHSFKDSIIHLSSSDDDDVQVIEPPATKKRRRAR